MKSLDREFIMLRKATISIDWCERHWWDEESGCLSFDTWKLVDAIYRSRALDLPGTGDHQGLLVFLTCFTHNVRSCHGSFD